MCMHDGCMRACVRACACMMGVCVHVCLCIHAYACAQRERGGEERVSKYGRCNVVVN